MWCSIFSLQTSAIIAPSPCLWPLTTGLGGGEISSSLEPPQRVLTLQILNLFCLLLLQPLEVFPEECHGSLGRAVHNCTINVSAGPDSCASVWRAHIPRGCAHSHGLWCCHEAWFSVPFLMLHVPFILPSALHSLSMQLSSRAPFSPPLFSPSLSSSLTYIFN